MSVFTKQSLKSKIPNRVIGEYYMSMTTVPYLNSFLVTESITLMFVALGLSIVGFAYAKLKTPESLKLHRYIMSGAIILTFISMFAVMIPSLYFYYALPQGSLTSGFSILQIIHSIESIPTAALSVMFLANRLPQPTGRWMRIMAGLWLVSIALGAVVFYTMPS